MVPGFQDSSRILRILCHRVGWPSSAGRRTDLCRTSFWAAHKGHRRSSLLPLVIRSTSRETAPHHWQRAIGRLTSATCQGLLRSPVGLRGDGPVASDGLPNLARCRPMASRPARAGLRPHHSSRFSGPPVWTGELNIDQFWPTRPDAPGLLKIRALHDSSAACVNMPFIVGLHPGNEVGL